jgi:hypothetical protein
MVAYMVYTLIRIEAQRIAAVHEGVGVHRFFVSLAQKILAAFRILHVLIDDKDDVVRGKDSAVEKEAHVPHDEPALVFGKAVRSLPRFEVFLHVDLFRRPVVRHAVLVVLARPLVFHGQDLVRVGRARV